MLAYIIILTCTIFVFAEAAFLDTLGKCSIQDEECLKTTYGNVIRDIGSTGIPEYDIPPIDPVVLKDVSLSVANLLKVTLVDGTVTGVSGCRFNNFRLDIKNERGTNEIACDLTVAGKYKLYSTGPLINTLLNGSNIHGEGNGKVVLDKVVLKLDFPFYAQKRDGNIYIISDYKSSKFDYDVLGKITFEADNLYVGDKESSNEIIGLMNDNWKLISGTVGKVFVEKAIDIYVAYTSKFFSVVPASNYITDDLTPYARP